jgi:hypothetical protein
VGRHIGRRVGAHCAKLQYIKERFVFAYSLLPKEHGTFAVGFHHNGDNQKHGA